MNNREQPFLLLLCGGIGSGKSLVLQYLKEHWGAYVIGMDQVAHRLYEKGEEGYGLALSLLGEKICGPDGSLDRTKMAELLYGEEKLLEAFNCALHPLVRRRTKEEAERAAERGEKFIVVESALPELDSRAKYPEIWYIHCAEALRIRRLEEHRGYTEERARQIIAKQPREQAYRKLASWILENEASPGEIYSRIDERLSILGLTERIE